MSTVSPIAGQAARAAIARAAERTGVDFDYLLAQARIESNLNPSARATTSSAAGLFQFTRSTWLQTLDKHGAAHGLAWTDAAISGGRVGDAAMRAEILALRLDPDASALMAAELAGDNQAALTPLLGREPDAAELYLAHFLGAGGASQLLSALQTNPDQSAAALLPKAAAANRSIFYERSGAPRSVGGLMELIRGKVETAMGNAGFRSPLGEGAEGWGLSAISNFALNDRPHPNTSPNGDGLAELHRPSMAETLRDTFGLASPDAPANAPSFVRAAYGSLRSLGL